MMSLQTLPQAICDSRPSSFSVAGRTHIFLEKNKKGLQASLLVAHSGCYSRTSTGADILFSETRSKTINSYFRRTTSAVFPLFTIRSISRIIFGVSLTPIFPPPL